MLYIFTCSDPASKLALSEFKKEDSSCRFIDWLDAGVGLIESELSLEEINQLIHKTPIIFVRHIFQVDMQIPMETKKEELLEQCKGYALSQLNAHMSFSVQARTIENETYKEYRNQLRDELNQLLVTEGYNLDQKDPEQVISIFFTPKTLFIGCGYTYLNLSKWNGGMMHCARENGEISRAEYKLREAIEVFSIDMNQYKEALDLGAAPGGWSNVLLSYGCNVTAIDPAKMDQRILANPKLKHYKETTQQYLARGLDKRYDIIVNDMKMDVVQSCAIINEFAHLLSENGLIVITFKLPNKYNYLNVKRGFEELKSYYHIKSARQLFHNRSEITVVLERL